MARMPGGRTRLSSGGHVAKTWRLGDEQSPRNQQVVNTPQCHRYIADHVEIVAAKDCVVAPNGQHRRLCRRRSRYQQLQYRPAPA